MCAYQYQMCRKFCESTGELNLLLRTIYAAKLGVLRWYPSVVNYHICLKGPDEIADRFVPKRNIMDFISPYCLA